jgi:arsenate reductase (thioredoxin)
VSGAAVAARVDIATAGTNPSAEVDPAVAAVLADRGLSVSHAYAKPLTDAVVRAPHVVVTLGCADAVSANGQARFDSDVPDPEGREPAEISALCDDLDRRITDLLVHLRVAPPPTA